MTIATLDQYEAEKIRYLHLKSQNRLDSQHVQELIDVRNELEAYERSLAPKSREDAYRQLVGIYHPWLAAFPARMFAQVLESRYGVPEVKLISEAQLADLLLWMRIELRKHETDSLPPAPEHTCPLCDRKGEVPGVCAFCLENDMMRLVRDEQNPEDPHARFLGAG